MGRSWAKEPGAETLAIICWRLACEDAARSGRAAPSPDGSAGGLGLVLVDALHDAALHVQGVVEELALAGGGVLDQLGEQRLLAGRRTRADQVEPHATGHLQGPQAVVLVADVGVADLGRRAVYAVFEGGPDGVLAGEDLDQVDHDQVAVGVDLADVGVVAAVGQGGHALALGAAGRAGRLLLAGAGAVLPLAGGGAAALVAWSAAGWAAAGWAAAAAGWSLRSALRPPRPRAAPEPMAATSTAPATNRATGRRRGGRGLDGRVGVSCSVVDMAPPPGVWLTPLPEKHGPAGSRHDTARGTRPTRFGHHMATAAGQTTGLTRFDGISRSAALDAHAAQALTWLGRLAGARTPTCCLQDSRPSSTAC